MFIDHPLLSHLIHCHALNCQLSPLHLPWTTFSFDSLSSFELWTYIKVLQMHWVYFFYNKLKICSNPDHSKFICSIFFQVSLCHILAIIFTRIPFSHYYYVSCGDLRSVIFDVTIVVLLDTQTIPYKMVNFKHCMCSDMGKPASRFPISQTFLELP